MMSQEKDTMLLYRSNSAFVSSVASPASSYNIEE